MRHSAAALPLLLAVACGAGGGGSNAPPPPPPVSAPTERVVSGLSSFPLACGGAGGTVYIHAEVEPYVAVNPRDANHMIAVWQQDRWSNGSARGLSSALSLDGGTTWTRTLVPFSHCSGGTAQNGGDYLRATDPWVAFSPDGTAYQMALVTSGGSFAQGSANAMTVSRSTDGGRIWSNPVALIRDTAPFFNDKNAITADPTDARFVYAVWDRLRQNAGGPAMLARTTDAGATWEAARAIHDPGPNAQTIGNLVRVLPDGALVDLFVQIDQPPGQSATAAVRVVRSTDKGATWSAPVTVAAHRAMGTRDLLTGRNVRDGNIVPQMAAGPDGSLHVVWQDARFTGQHDAIAYSRSTDGGLTWSAPARVNAVAAAAAFTPQVHVLANGTIGVTYYDLRSRGADPATLPTEYWIARSSDGGATWGETRIAGPFDLLLAPDAGGLFLGDYMGLESAGSTFVALYTRTTTGIENRTDVFMARVPATPPAARYGAGEAKRLADEKALDRLVAQNIERALAERGRKAPP